MTTTIDGKTVEVEVLDLEESHDVPGYGEWNCEVTFPDGTVRQGVIWGDEHRYEPDTLELVDEDPTPYCAGCKAMKKENCHCGPILPDD